MIQPKLQARTAKRRPRRPPFRQGDLDGLCGVYAVVNAVATVAPRMTQPEAGRLFRAVMAALRAGDAARVPLVSGGLSRKGLAMAIQNADQFARRKLGGRLASRRVSKALADPWSIEALWKLLENHLSPTCVAIIGIEGIHSHWTLAVSVTPKAIHLVDSGNLKFLKRSRCRTRPKPGSNGYHIIDRGSVTFIRWKPLSR